MKVLVLTMFAAVLACNGCGSDRNGGNGTPARDPASVAPPAPVAATPETPPPVESPPGAARKWGFEEDVAEQLPAGFTSLIGKWQIATDESARSNSRVLAQLAASEDHIYNVALVEDSSYRNVDISVRLRSVSGREEGDSCPCRSLCANPFISPIS